MNVVIDRIEGNIAIIELPERGGRIEIPVKFLPKGAGEGNVLDMSFRLNKEEEKSRREKIKKMQEDLKKRK